MKNKIELKLKKKYIYIIHIQSKVDDKRRNIFETVTA